MKNLAILEGIIFTEGSKIELRTFVKNEKGEPTAVVMPLIYGGKTPEQGMYKVAAEVITIPDGLAFHALQFIRA
jgi:hypothetical protein